MSNEKTKERYSFSLQKEYFKSKFVLEIVKNNYCDVTEGIFDNGILCVTVDAFKDYVQTCIGEDYHDFFKILDSINYYAYLEVPESVYRYFELQKTLEV
jgi:hypothetical protein